MSIYDSLTQGNSGSSGKTIYDSLTPPQATPRQENSLEGGIRQVTSDVSNVWNAPEPKSVPFTPQNVLDRTQNWGEAIIKGWSDFGDSLVHPKVTDTNYATNAVNAIGNSGVKFIQAFFTPVSNLFEQASTLPGPLGTVANKVNKIFAVAGTEGADAAEGIINTLPITQKTKDTLTPLFKDIGALGAQIVLGKGTDMMQDSVVAKTKTILTTLSEDSRLNKLSQNLPIPKQVPVTSQGGETQVPVQTPSTKQAAYAKSQGYEPYIPNEQLPSIDMGGKPKTILQSIQQGEPTPAQVGEPRQSILQSIEEPTTQKTPISQAIDASPTDVSQTSLKIQQLAKENGITVPDSELAKIDRMDMSVEAQKARDLIQKDPQAAVKSVMNDTTPVAEVRPGTILTELVKKAVGEGDANLVNELSRSKVGTQAAQGLKAFDNLDLEANPVKAVSDLRTAKIKSSGVKNIESEMTKGVSDIKSEIQKAHVSSARTWADFIQSLTC